MTTCQPVRVLVGILASGEREKTLNCLQSLAASDFAAFDVYLVDNGSGESIAEAATTYPFVTARTLPANRGCAGGRNVILEWFRREGRWDYLFFLDNDGQVRPDTLGNLLAAATALQERGVKLGGIGPHVYYLDRQDTYWIAGGGQFDWPGGWFTASGNREPHCDELERPRRLDTLAGGFMFITREAVEAVGDFIEEYFIYLEDTDWCRRLVCAGFEFWSAPSAVCLHDASSSLGSCSPRFYYLRTRNRLWFFSAYAPPESGFSRRTLVRDVVANSLLPELKAGRLRRVLAIAAGLAGGLFVPRAIREAASQTVNPSSCAT
jgi:GT2 family glycosyltransferase